MVEAVWNRHGAFVHQQIIWVKDRPILTPPGTCGSTSRASSGG
jgi:hypothetical protein